MFIEFADDCVMVVIKSMFYGCEHKLAYDIWISEESLVFTIYVAAYARPFIYLCHKNRILNYDLAFDITTYYKL